MIDPRDFAMQVYERVPAYRRLLDRQGLTPQVPWQELPITDKRSYLLANEMEDLCWDGSLAGCHQIGASSGFGPSGPLFWPKRPQDETAYLESLENMLVDRYGIDRRPTLVLVCLALGTWMAGMQLASSLRTLAASGRHRLTVATPGLNLGEAVDIQARFQAHFQQILWITNVSSVSLIAALMERRGLEPAPGSVFFGVVGEYFPESLRVWAARRFGHPPEEPFCLWTGYGSADAGDLGVETRETIALRKFIYARPELSRRMFGSENTPIILAANPNAHLEIIEGRIVVSKDQLIPLVRYDTGDNGGLLNRQDLAAWPELPPELVQEAPESILWVAGRASDALVFYGTNLMVGDINDHLLSLPADMGYGGSFELVRREESGITVFRFKVYVRTQPSPELAERYARTIVEFLQSQSLEFKTKYQALCASLGQELIQVELADAAQRPANLKHKFLAD